MGYGIYGLIHNSAQTQPAQWIRWFLGGLLVHDFVIAPLVFLVAAVLLARVPRRFKAVLQGASIASGILVLTTWPYVAGYGRRPDNPTLLPNDYLGGLLAILAVVWAIAGAIAFWDRQVHRGEKRRTRT